MAERVAAFRCLVSGSSPSSCHHAACVCVYVARFRSVLRAGEKFKPKDLIPLVNGGTSFTASGQVEVTKYAPALR